MSESTTIYLDFSEYGYDDFLPIDICWMNFQYGIAEEWFEANTIDDLYKQAYMKKLDLIKTSDNLSVKWVGEALLTMAMFGLLGLSIPDYYYEY